MMTLFYNDKSYNQDGFDHVPDSLFANVKIIVMFLRDGIENIQTEINMGEPKYNTKQDFQQQIKFHSLQQFSNYQFSNWIYTDMKDKLYKPVADPFHEGLVIIFHEQKQRLVSWIYHSNQ